MAALWPAMTRVISAPDSGVQKTKLIMADRGEYSKGGERVLTRHVEDCFVDGTGLGRVSGKSGQ